MLYQSSIPFFQLLFVYLGRVPQDMISHFLGKTKGFHLMAAQVYQHYATCGLVEALLSLVIGKECSIEER